MKDSNKLEVRKSCGIFGAMTQNDRLRDKAKRVVGVIGLKIGMIQFHHTAKSSNSTVAALLRGQSALEGYMRTGDKYLCGCVDHKKHRDISEEIYYCTCMKPSSINDTVVIITFCHGHVDG